MNDKLKKYKEEMMTKKVAVLGIGISNTLCGLGVNVTAFDKAEIQNLQPAMELLAGCDVKYSLGKKYLETLHGFDVIFKTPKVRYDIPELLREAEAGTEITSEMEVFCELCPARIFAVTGSDGKTTTTTLIYKILNHQGYKCWLGGNIGTPLLDRIDEIEENDMVVLELSSFQLHTMKNRIHTAIVTNISPNHLDVHKSMEEYTEAKKNIFLYQTQKDLLILNYDNPATRSFAKKAPGKPVFFSRQSNLPEGACLADGWLVYRSADKEVKLVKSEEILLPGVHNIENYMAAAAATIDFAAPEAVREIAVTFRGVEHRNEFVRELNGVSFYNDSIGSSPTRTIASVNSFKDRVILIAGGYDKNIPYDVLGNALIERVKFLVLIGQTAGQIEKAFMDESRRRGMETGIPVVHCDSLEEAVKTAYQSASANDIIILSPASASFDMFSNFEERGLTFKNIVNNLI